MITGRLVRWLWLAALATVPWQGGIAAWDGEVELGISDTTGNTETRRISAKAKAVYEIADWQHNLQAEALQSSDDGATTAERYYLQGKSAYNFTEFNYVFGVITYEDDRFSGFERRISEAVGYGRRLIRRPDLKLDAELGLGARHSTPQGGDTNNEVMVRAAAALEWAISETAKFGEDLNVEATEDATIARSITSLTAQVNDRLSSRFSYTIKHTSEVPPGIEKTDTETSVTLVYTF